MHWQFRSVFYIPVVKNRLLPQLPRYSGVHLIVLYLPCSVGHTRYILITPAVARDYQVPGTVPPPSTWYLLPGLPSGTIERSTQHQVPWYQVQYTGNTISRSNIIELSLFSAVDAGVMVQLVGNLLTADEFKEEGVAR